MPWGRGWGPRLPSEGEVRGLEEDRKEEEEADDVDENVCFSAVSVVY